MSADPCAPLRWKECSPSQHPHEQAALDWLHNALCRKDLRVWTNAEFVARDGSIRELDAIVLGTQGLFVVEIKNHAGTLESYGREWSFLRPGNVRTSLDNPLYLANLKCKQLKERILPDLGARDSVFLQPAIFLSNLAVGSDLHEAERAWVAARSDAAVVREGKLNDIALLLEKGAHRWPERRPRPLDASLIQKLTRILDNLLTRRKPRERRAGNFLLDGLLDEGYGYQDWLGVHQANGRDKRRVRIFTAPEGVDEPELERVTRSAKREYELLLSFNDGARAVPGIPRVRDFLNTDDGPCVLYAHEEGSQRLDHWLREHERDLDAADRIRLLRFLGETLRHAHRAKLFHRALKPSSILVHRGAPEWNLEILHWQTAVRVTGSSDSLSDTGTLHPEALVEAPGQVYLAPELFTDPKGSEYTDVFGLGAIAYRLFAGQAPASHVGERDQILSRVGWLSVSANVDGILPSIDQLVADATSLDVASRATLEDFLEQCARILVQLEDASDDALANPLEANQESRLRDVERGTWIVQARVGQGSSALGLRVQDPQGERCVLKLARDPRYNERLREEGALLQRLEGSTANVVRCFGIHEFDSPLGRLVALALDDAGVNLSDRLRQQVQIPLADLERWGEDLLQAVEALESAGVFHRDLKPDNLGIQGADDNPSKRNRLVLYDFSLSGVPVDQIRVGTAGYIDPWLPLRRPPRYDTAAERWSAVATLHEMATGVLPRKEQDALVLACERIPAYREQFRAFFEKALGTNVDARAGTARALRLEWIRVFAAGREAEAALPRELQRRRAEDSGPDDHLATLDLDPAVTDALKSNGICTVRELLAHPARKLYALHGVGGGRLRDTLQDFRRRLQETHPSLESVPLLVGDGDLTTLTQGLADQSKANLEHLAQGILDSDPKGYVLAQLGLLALPEVRARFPQWQESALPVASSKHPWFKGIEWAAALGVHPTTLSIPLNKAKEGWKSQGRLRAVAHLVQDTLVAAGGVLGADDLASELLRQRGSDRSDLREKQILSRAVLRAVLEVEALYVQPAFRVVRKEHATFVVLTRLEPIPRSRKVGETEPSRLADQLSNWVQSLGEAADALVAEWPLPSRQRVLDRLARVSPDRSALPPDLPRPTSRQILQWASLASVRACVDPREELYPSDIPVSRLVPLLVAGYPEQEPLSLEGFNRLRQGRYPESEPITDRDAVGRVLASFDFRAQPNGTWVRAYSASASVRSATFARLAPTSATHQIADRLDTSCRQGGFLALTVAPLQFQTALRWLRERYPQTRLLDLDALLLDELESHARAKGIQWDKLVLADRGGPDWSRLQAVVRQLHVPLERALIAQEGAVLALHAGLWARYDLLPLLERHLLRRAGTVPLERVWMLVPGQNPSNLPTVNERPLPILGPQEHFELPQDWLRTECIA